MAGTAILWPVMALIGLTAAVCLLVGVRRFRAASQGKVTADDFKVGESANVPPAVTIANKAFMNLLEVPVLFYVVCLIYFVTGPVTGPAVALAWIYVGLRLAHALVYLTYNKVMHRFTVYAASNTVLVILWACLFPRLMG